MTGPSRRFAKVATAAEVADLSARTIYRLISDGKLTAYRFGSRSTRIDLDELDALFTPAGDVA